MNYTTLLQDAGFNNEDQTFFLQTLDIKKNKPAKFAKLGKKLTNKFRTMNRTLRAFETTQAMLSAKAPKVRKFEDKVHVRWTQETLNAFNSQLSPMLGVGETTDQQIFWQEYLRHLHTYKPTLAMFECRVRRHFDKYAIKEVPLCGEAVGGREIQNDRIEFCQMVHEGVLGRGSDNPNDTFYTLLQPRVVRGEQIAELRAIFRRDLDKMVTLWTSLK